jgi:translation initiation factor 4A
MSPATKMAALNKFRGGNSSAMMKQQQQQSQPSSRVLVVFDVQVKSPDVFQVPLIINYGKDLPSLFCTLKLTMS